MYDKMPLSDGFVQYPDAEELARGYREILVDLIKGYANTESAKYRLNTLERPTYILDPE